MRVVRMNYDSNVRAQGERNEKIEGHFKMIRIHFGFEPIFQLDSRSSSASFQFGILTNMRTLMRQRHERMVYICLSYSVK